MNKLISLLVCMLLFASCKTSKPASEAIQPQPSATASAHAGSALPKAIVYKANPRYIDMVPVGVAPGTTRLTSFPAPTDITPYTAPIALKEGFYLDCQGVGVNTMFLDWTRQEYSRLESTPALSELERHLIPGSGVLEIVQLPISLNEARTDTALVNRFITDNFQGCTYIKGAPVRFDPARMPSFTRE